MKHKIYRSRRRKLALRVGIGPCILALIVSVTACSPSSGGSNVFATYQASSTFGEGDGALLTGTLIEKTGCLVIETDDGGTVLPAFPFGTTTWDGSANVLTLDGTDHRLGGQVSFGGGYTSNYEDLAVPEACRSPQEAFVVSSAVPPQ